MGKFICVVCGKELGLLDKAGYPKCSKCGMICKSCRVKSLLGMGIPKCPKCGKELKAN